MEKVVKRLFDLVLALILFIPASLILLCGVIFVKIVSPESLPIFKQERVGYLLGGKYAVVPVMADVLVC